MPRLLLAATIEQLNSSSFQLRMMPDSSHPKTVTTLKIANIYRIRRLPLLESRKLIGITGLVYRVAFVCCMRSEITSLLP
jgi:hypothetical protein